MPKSASDKRHFIIAAALIVVSTVVVFYLLETILPLPRQGSDEALVIDGLIHSHLLVIAFLFSLVVVFMIYALIVFRKREGDESEGEHFEGNTVLEIVWTVVPLIFVVVFAFYGINALAQVTHSEPNEFQVKAEGQQWSWDFVYPNGVVSPELVLPVNRRIHFTLHSKDVIHSFWIPEMRVKQDLVPGEDTQIRFTPIITGDFKVRCAELCGRSHYSMLADVHIMEQADYDKWMSDQEAAQLGGGSTTVTGTTTISGTANISGTTTVTGTTSVTDTSNINNSSK
jgi:cytochrome c oxidase subunit 2